MSLSAWGLYWVEWDWQQGLKPMIDDTPYIIVDDLKIAPIGRSPQLNSEAENRARWEERPFGVVDRVTISSEARVKARYHQAHAEAEPWALANPQALNDQPKQLQTVNIPLLTYPPKPRR